MLYHLAAERLIRFRIRELSEWWEDYPTEASVTTPCQPVKPVRFR
jgi:hypothetical protein